MDREEARAKVGEKFVAGMKRPSEHDLRAYGLDRATQDSVVNALAAGLIGDTMTPADPEKVCQAVIATAHRFAEWVKGDEERPEARANMGLASTRELLDEVEVRLRLSKYYDHAATVKDLTASLRPGTLNYRTVDNA
jgi:hypothetical protein